MHLMEQVCDIECLVGYTLHVPEVKRFQRKFLEGVTPEYSLAPLLEGLEDQQITCLLDHFDSKACAPSAHCSTRVFLACGHLWAWWHCDISPHASHRGIRVGRHQLRVLP